MKNIVRNLKLSIFFNLKVLTHGMIRYFKVGTGTKKCVQILKVKSFFMMHLWLIEPSHSEFTEFQICPSLKILTSWQHSYSNRQASWRQVLISSKKILSCRAAAVTWRHTVAIVFQICPCLKRSKSFPNIRFLAVQKKFSLQSHCCLTYGRYCYN